MVKKLLKHELLSYVRLLIPVYLAVFGMAVFGRVVQLFETDTTIYELAFGSTLVLYALAALVACVLVTIYVILRFYRHLFTGEGYLTFTLPATPTQHLCVKLIGAAVCYLVTYVMILLSMMVLGAGDVLVEVFKAAGYLFEQAYKAIGFHIVAFVIEFILIVLVAIVSECMVYYTCIAIGQTFKKNRVLAAVGIYFAYYMITQAIGTILSIVLTAGATVLPIDTWMLWIENNPCEFVHWVMAFSLVWSIALSTVFFFVTRHILRNKLNLE